MFNVCAVLQQNYNNVAIFGMSVNYNLNAKINFILHSFLTLAKFLPYCCHENMKILVVVCICVCEGFESGNGDQYFNATFQVDLSLLSSVDLLLTGLLI